MSEPYETPSEPIPAAMIVPERMGKKLRIIWAIAGLMPIVAAGFGYMLILKFIVMFEELGAHPEGLTGWLLYRGGVVPMGILAATGLAMIVSAWSGKLRWMILTVLVAALAIVTVLPLTISQINTYLSRFEKL